MKEYSADDYVDDNGNNINYIYKYIFVFCVIIQFTLRFALSLIVIITRYIGYLITIAIKNVSDLNIILYESIFINNLLLQITLSNLYIIHLVLK